MEKSHQLPVDQVKHARELIADIKASARNKFRNNPEALAEWFIAPAEAHRMKPRRCHL